MPPRRVVARTASARAVALSDNARRQRVETRVTNQRVAASIDHNRERLRSASPPARVLRDAHTVVDEPVLTVGRRGTAQPTFAPPMRAVIQRIVIQSLWFAPMVSALIGVAVGAAVALVFVGVVWMPLFAEHGGSELAFRCTHIKCHVTRAETARI